MWRLLEPNETILKSDSVLLGSHPNGTWCSVDVHGGNGERVKPGMVVRRIMKDAPGLTDQMVADISSMKKMNGESCFAKSGISLG